MRTTQPVNSRALGIAYCGATLAAVIVNIMLQTILVLTGLFQPVALKWNELLQSVYAIVFIYFFGFVLDMVGPHIGLKRWQPVALLCIVIVFVYSLAVLTHNLPIIKRAFGISMITVLVMTVFFSSRFVGERLHRWADATTEQ